MARMHACHDCSAATPHAYRLCDTCLRATTVAERAAQGLPPTVEDPTVLRQVAQLLGFTDPGNALRVAS